MTKILEARVQEAGCLHGAVLSRIRALQPDEALPENAAPVDEKTVTSDWVIVRAAGNDPYAQARTLVLNARAIHAAEAARPTAEVAVANAAEAARPTAEVAATSAV